MRVHCEEECVQIGNCEEARLVTEPFPVLWGLRHHPTVGWEAIRGWNFSNLLPVLPSLFLLVVAGSGCCRFYSTASQNVGKSGACERIPVCLPLFLSRGLFHRTNEHGDGLNWFKALNASLEKENLSHSHDICIYSYGIAGKTLVIVTVS